MGPILDSRPNRGFAMDAKTGYDVIGDCLLEAALDRERQLDDQIAALDNVGEEDLLDLRRKRLEAMKGQAAERKKKLAVGHGEYELIEEKNFFEICKKSDRIVVHFFRPSAWRCEVMDRHLRELSQKHWGTRFVKVNAEKSPYLAERLHIWCLPSLVLCKNGKTDHTVVGFSEFKTGDEATTEEVEELLARWGMVDMGYD